MQQFNTSLSGGWSVEGGGAESLIFRHCLLPVACRPGCVLLSFFSFFLNLQTIRFDYLTGWRHYNILSGFSPLSSECDLVNANKQLAFVTEKQRHLAIVFLSCFCATNPKQMSVCYF